MLADACAGIACYDDAMYKAFIGTPEGAGRHRRDHHQRTQAGRETGLFEHDVGRAELVAYEIVNQ